MFITGHLEKAVGGGGEKKHKPVKTVASPGMDTGLQQQVHHNNNTGAAVELLTVEFYSLENADQRCVCVCVVLCPCVYVGQHISITVQLLQAVCQEH